MIHFLDRNPLYSGRNMDQDDLVHITLTATSILFIFHLAHGGRVNSIMFISDSEWLISAGRDKTFQFYCTKTGRKLGSFEAQAWCMDVEYP